MGSSNPWPPYKDCSLGICSIYCPKFCYVIFPPPPPSNNNNNSEDSSSTGTFLSPLVIAVMGILASAFLLVTYYLVVTRYCHRRSSSRVDGVVVVAQESAAESTGGVEERVIKAIGVYKYKKGEGLVEGTDCSVCLTEFEEDDTLRVMPKCTHAFHLPCIDTWLNSHSTCPLCRSSVLEFPPAAPHVTVTAHASTHQVDTLLIICDSSSASAGTIIPHVRQAVVDSDTVPTSPKHQPPNTDPPMRRSASAASGGCSYTCEPVGQLAMAVGTTHPFLKRSISCDRFTSARCERKLIYPV